MSKLEVKEVKQKTKKGLHDSEFKINELKRVIRLKGLKIQF